MADLCKKFANAAKMISLDENSVQQCVYNAYQEHLSDIDTDDLPEELRIFYESVKIRLTSVFPPGDIGKKESVYLAKDILYMAEIVQLQCRGAKKPPSIR